MPTTPFSFILGKHRQQQDTKSTETSESELVQLPLTENIPAITELLHTPAHVLPSASFLCTLFVNSLLLSKETKSAEEISDDVDMEGNEESDDSDEEYDLTEKAKETSNPDLGEDAIHQLSKSEEKELRKFRSRSSLKNGTNNKQGSSEILLCSSRWSHHGLGELGPRAERS